MSIQPLPMIERQMREALKSRQLILIVFQSIFVSSAIAWIEDSRQWGHYHNSNCGFCNCDKIFCFVFNCSILCKILIFFLLHCRHAAIEVLPWFLVNRRKLAYDVLGECWRCFSFDRRLVVIEWQIGEAELIVIGDFCDDKLRRHKDSVIADWARLAYVTAKNLWDARRGRFRD